MTTTLLVLHILVCFSLIGIVLIQGGKGADIGATFGAGASHTIFGATGGQSFIAKMTTSAAIVFMLTSLALAMFWGQAGSDSVMPSQVTPAQTQQAPPVENSLPATAPTEDSAPQPAAPTDNN